MNRDLLNASIWGVATHPWVLLQAKYRTSARAKIITALRKQAKLPTQVAPSTAGAAMGRGLGLVSVAVGPRFSGKGIGVALVRELENRARDQGYDYVQLSVYANNDRAKAVYLKAGWEISLEGQSVVNFTKRLSDH